MPYPISACIVVAFLILSGTQFGKIEAKEQPDPAGKDSSSVGNSNNSTEPPNNNHTSQGRGSKESGNTLDDPINSATYHKTDAPLILTFGTGTEERDWNWDLPRLPSDPHLPSRGQSEHNKQDAPSPSGNETPLWGLSSPKITTEETTEGYLCKDAIGYQCIESKKCINKDLMCDGVEDCEDGSDEIGQNCQLDFCFYLDPNNPSEEHANYTDTCEGIQRCFNISDDASCFGTKINSPPILIGTTQSPVTPAVAVLAESAPVPGSCVMPKDPAHGVYVIGNSAHGTYKPGVSIPQFQALIPQCNEPYKPRPPCNQLSVCINGQWRPAPADCSLACQPKNSTSTTTIITYKFRGIPLKMCNDIVDDTVATITCQPLYEELSLARLPTRICKNGKWNQPFVECYAKCGIKKPKGVPTIIKGELADNGSFPWHVAVYQAATKEYKCGGSILNDRAVLSAAHCFSKLSNGKRYPKENYVIAAGKYYSKYDEKKDKYAQYSDVEEIYLPDRYKGEQTSYEGDIALVILTTGFSYSWHVLPVCLDRYSIADVESVILANAPGTVVGWGRTSEDGEASEVLKELIVPYIPFTQCYNEMPIVFRRFLTHDKVCAGILNQGQATCEGDSGGGLVFQNYDERYYIRGIVSTSPATARGTCDSNQRGTYTRVSKYINFIQEHEFF